MAFSSVSVVGSSLTLRWWRRPRMARRADDPHGDRPEGTVAEVLGALVDGLNTLTGTRSRNPKRMSGYGPVRASDSDAEEEAIPLVQSSAAEREDSEGAIAI